MSDIFNVKDKLTVAGKDHAYYSLPKLAEKYPNINTLPYSMKIVLENLLRTSDGFLERSDIIWSMNAFSSFSFWHCLCLLTSVL